MSRAALLVVSVFGCGRVNFDAHTDASSAPDVPLAAGTCADPIDLEQVATQTGDFLHFRGTTAGAIDHGEPLSPSCACASPSPDVVFRYTPPASGRIEVIGQSVDNNWDPMVHARLTCTDAASAIGCEDDTGLLNDPAEPRGFPGAWFEADVTAGVPIYLFADGCASSGTFDLDVHFVPMPFTGTCANPIELATAGTVQSDGSIALTGDTSLAFDHGDSSCDCESPSPDVVIRWVPTTTGMADLQLNGDYDVLIHARSTCAAVASELGCNDDSPNFDSETAIPVTAGQPVFIYADGCRVLQRGTFQLRVVPP